ncbi:MAG: hypothetical protein WHT81_03900 [Rectinemataceae bacterium]|nr:hypothetical protein [Spirochaetaceae bacterium]MDH7483074.1 hypothetical protein [Spirochaetales bacterium]
MAFSDKLKKFLETSVDASRDFLEKAADQAQVWGEMGKLKIEIIQLRSKAQNLASKVGMEVYNLLIEKQEPMIGASTPEIEPLLRELKEIDALIDEKEALYKSKGGKESDLDQGPQNQAP